MVWIHLPKEGGIDHDTTINSDFHLLSFVYNKGFASAVAVVRAYHRYELQTACEEVGPNPFHIGMVLKRECLKGVDRPCPTELGDLQFD